MFELPIAQPQEFRIDTCHAVVDELSEALDGIRAGLPKFTMSMMGGMLSKQRENVLFASLILPFFTSPIPSFHRLYVVRVSPWSKDPECTTFKDAPGLITCLILFRHKLCES